MMNYHSKDNKNKKTKLLLVTLFFILLFFYSELIGILNGFFNFVTYPIWVSEKKIKEQIINPISFATDKKDLILSIKKLKSELNSAQLEIARKNILLKENIELKEIMGRTDNPDSIILASVLAGPGVSVYDTLIVDVGNNLGVKEGDQVFAKGNIFIGKITKVMNNKSIIKLYSSPKEEVSMRVGFNNINSIAKGIGGGNFEVKVPRDADVHLGDPVFTSEINPLLLGSVEEIYSDKIDPLKTLLFKSPLNIFELKWVQILKTE